MADDSQEPGFLDEMRTAVRYNGTAYGYSVLITGTFGVLGAQLDSPTVGQVFLFAAGAAVGFIVIDAIASKGFRERARGERSEVVMLGSALALVSVTAGIGAGALAGAAIDGGAAWPLGSLAATIVYLLVVTVEYLLARRAED